MFQNPPEGVSEIHGNEGYCFNCNALIEVSSIELFDLQFTCPECGAVNRIIPISASAQQPEIAGETLIIDNEGTCFKCKLNVEISEEERIARKFICPGCSAVNNITFRYEDWKKYLPLIPFTLAVIVLYLFARVGDILNFKEELGDSSHSFIFLNVIIFLRIAALLFLFYIIYIYFKKPESFKNAFNNYTLFLILAFAASTFLLYYTVYLFYHTDSIINSGSNTDWDLISRTITYASKGKFFTITETCTGLLFLLIYWRGCNYVLSRIES